MCGGRGSCYNPLLPASTPLLRPQGLTAWPTPLLHTSETYKDFPYPTLIPTPQHTPWLGLPKQRFKSSDLQIYSSVTGTHTLHWLCLRCGWPVLGDSGKSPLRLDDSCHRMAAVTYGPIFLRIQAGINGLSTRCPGVAAPAGRPSLLLKLTLLCSLLHAHRPEGLGHPTGENEGVLLDLGRLSKSWLWAASATTVQSWEAKPALRKNRG